MPLKFGFFHLMPYSDFAETNVDWPVPNRYLDPRRAQRMFDDYVETLVFAEECGFDWIGLNEHHFGPYGLMANPNVVAGALAYRTKRAMIAICGNIVPMNNPVRIAEEYAMVDCMSGGRLIAGLIRGAPHEYVAYDVDPSESWERQREGVDLILRSWTEREPFAWNSKHYRFSGVSIWPRPIQQPHPPIVMSATSPDSIQFAAKSHATMAMNMFITDLAVPKRQIAAFRAAAHEYGWTPGPEHILIGMHCCIADTDGEAQDILRAGQQHFHGVLRSSANSLQQRILKTTTYNVDEAHRNRMAQRSESGFGQSLDDAIEAGTVVCGSPETVIKQIRRIHDRLGHGIFNLTMKVGDIPESAVRHGMELFRDHVLPRVREETLA